MAEQDPSNKFIPDLSGPYQQYLSQTQPQPQQALQQPNGREGKTGQWAYFIDQFIEGAQRGRWQKQQGELMKERQSDQTVQQYLKLLDDKDPVQAQQLRQQIVTEQGKQAMAFMEQSSKGKGKKGEEGPHQHVLGAVKSLGQGLLGGPVKKWEGYGDKLGQWSQQILNMPDRKAAEQRDYNGVWNAAVQQAYTEAKTKNPNRDPFEEEITGHPAVVKAQQYMQSYYQADPMKQLQQTGAYGKDPDRNKTPEQREADKSEAIKRDLEAKDIIDILKDVDSGKAGKEFKATPVKYGTDGTGLNPAYLARLQRVKRATPNLQISVDGKNVNAWMSDGEYYDPHGNHITGEIARYVTQPQERWINIPGGALGADGKWHPMSRNNVTDEIHVNEKLTVRPPAGEGQDKDKAKRTDASERIRVAFRNSTAAAEKAFEARVARLQDIRSSAHVKDLSAEQRQQAERDYNDGLKTAEDALKKAKMKAQISFGEGIDQLNYNMSDGKTRTNFAGEYASKWATGDQDEIKIDPNAKDDDDEETPVQRTAPPKADDKPAAAAPAAKQAAPAGGLSMKELLDKMKKKKPGQ